MSVDLAVLGSLLLDDIVYADGETRMAQPGGAALYVALGASLWNIDVGIVSRVGDDYPTDLLAALEERGIDLEGVRPTGGPTLRTWLLYEGRRRRVVHRLGGPTHDDASPAAADIPSSWHPAALHLAPMPWERQRSLIGSLESRREILLSADPYELLNESSMEPWRRLFTRLDILFLSEDEMTIPGALDSPVPVIERLAARTTAGDDGRLTFVVYKRGALGGLLYDTETGRAHSWETRSEAVIDPTGAGDAFAGGVLAGRLLDDPMPKALERGVVSASFALEAQGADKLFAANPWTASRRLSDWFGDR